MLLSDRDIRVEIAAGTSSAAHQGCKARTAKDDSALEENCWEATFD